MRECYHSCSCLLVLLALVHLGYTQVPPRLHIPGAVLVGNYPTALPPITRRLDGGGGPPPRLRRPPPPQNLPPLREVRPVTEEEEDNYAPPSQSIASFDAEVNKLSESALASAVRQAEDQEQQTQRPQQQVQFRPEKPIPVTRDQIREKPSPLDLPVFRPQQRPIPIQRQEQQQRPIARPPPPPRPIRPIVRQEIDDEEENIPRQHTRQQPRQQAPPQQVYRPAHHNHKGGPRTAEDNESQKQRKPVVQILKKYRTDNPDGSITWGFENEDGTFKEETLGTDCTIKGKYGYVDPEGVRREFEYEAGNKCDPNRRDIDEDDEDLPPPPPPQHKKPHNIGKQQVQFRPQQLAQPQY
ncbi:unnamed protein product [Callosobruchus maculatus]|uniref:Uncharacterized protein n=1 Tax=Callosobruchus maculatus TaxID=64391 RepID=A0A653D459_CALMS|nr:unnamed protein product [Callosobruchus maculatus]